MPFIGPGNYIYVSPVCQKFYLAYQECFASHHTALSESVYSISTVEIAIRECLSSLRRKNLYHGSSERNHCRAWICSGTWVLLGYADVRCGRKERKTRACRVVASQLVPFCLFWDRRSGAKWWLRPLAVSTGATPSTEQASVQYYRRQRGFGSVATSKPLGTSRLLDLATCMCCNGVWQTNAGLILESAEKRNWKEAWGSWLEVRWMIPYRTVLV